MPELLELDRATFIDRFGESPFLVRHSLTEHPLLSVEAIAELADFLPSAQVEHNLGDLPTVLNDTGVELARVEMSPGEIARGIETNGCWMVLKGIETHPDYRRLLDASLDEVEGYVEEVDGEMRRRMGFIFLSAPGSVTPLHIDNEHNLLLQIRGEKEMTIGRFANKGIYEHELERLYSGGETRYLENAPESDEAFKLTPGDGICVPISAPHSVKNGDAVSVSLSITFQTPSSQRVGNIYALNSRLRRLHLTPKPPTGGPLDAVKDVSWRAARQPARAVRDVKERLAR